MQARCLATHAYAYAPVPHAQLTEIMMKKSTKTHGIIRFVLLDESA